MVNNKILVLLISIAVVAIDQLTKYLIKIKFALGDTVNLLPFLSFTRIHNTGAAFGILQQYTFLLILASIVVLVIFLFSYGDLIKDTKSTIFGALVIGGAIGNLIDRIAYGFVIDFIDLTFWPAFNIADSCITIGGIGLFIVFLKSSMK